MGLNFIEFHSFCLFSFKLILLIVDCSRFNTRVSYAVTITKEQGWSVACPLRTSISQYQWRYAGRNQRTTDCTLSNARFFLTLPTRAIAGFMSLRWHLSCHQGPAQSLAMLLRHRRSSNGDRWPFSRVLPCWHQELLPQKDSLPSSYMTNGTAFSYGHLRLGDSVFRTYTPGLH